MEKTGRYKILIPDIMSPPAAIEAEVFGSNGEITAFSARHSHEIPDDLWRECDAVIAFNNIVYDKKLLSKLKNCKAIVRSGIGYDNIDIEEAGKRNIIVCNVPDYCTEEVADHAMALMLALVRGFPGHTRKVKNRAWERTSHISFRLKGKVFGIVGLGRIGSATAVRAKAYGLNVVFYDPYVKEGADRIFSAAKVDTLAELARVSDIVSLHPPLTDETYQMIDDSFFAAVKKGMILINTARGKVVDIDSLEKAMRDDIVKACGLDVLPVEPSDDSQNLIVDYEKGAEWLRDRLIVTPHTAFYSHEALEELREKAALEAMRVLEGKRARNRVN